MANYASGIIIKHNKILLIKRPMHDEYEPGKWTPINETIEAGETPKEAVVRGVKEEVNLDFYNVKHLFDQEKNKDAIHVFLGDFKGELIPEIEEVSEYGWYTYEEAKKLEFARIYEGIIEKIKELTLFSS